MLHKGLIVRKSSDSHTRGWRTSSSLEPTPFIHFIRLNDILQKRNVWVESYLFLYPKTLLQVYFKRCKLCYCSFFHPLSSNIYFPVSGYALLVRSPLTMDLPWAPLHGGIRCKPVYLRVFRTDAYLFIRLWPWYTITDRNGPLLTRLLYDRICGFSINKFKIVFSFRVGKLFLVIWVLFIISIRDFIIDCHGFIFTESTPGEPCQDKVIWNWCCFTCTL